MVMVYISLYFCLLLSLIAIGALLIEAIKERHAQTKDTETEYYDHLWKEFHKQNKAERRAERLERKHTRKERREKERKRREFEREERRFKRALNHIDKGKTY